MKLHLPDIMRHMRGEPFGVIHVDGGVDLIEPTRKHRDRMFQPFLTDMHKAEKFIFDSGTDQDVETVSAVRSTAFAMLEHGLLHLPAPLCWIEDPFDSDTDKDGAHRLYYLCKELKTEIVVVLFQLVDPLTAAELPRSSRRALPKYTMFGNPFLISLEKPSDLFNIVGADSAVPELSRAASTAVYSVKKFLVTLAAQQTVRERVEPPRVRGVSTGPRKEYAHTVVRIPTYIPERTEGTGDARGPQGRRRMGLVAGYVWGKNTRPLEQQRWIAPFWRGNAALGFVAPKVRVVTAATETHSHG